MSPGLGIPRGVEILPVGRQGRFETKAAISFIISRPEATLPIIRRTKPKFRVKNALATVPSIVGVPLVREVADRPFWI
jgi:hypothetical protein